MFPLLFISAHLLLGGQGDLQSSGLQALQHQDYSQAEQIFSKLTAADPKDYSAYFNLALAQSGLKKDEDAALNYQHVLELKPGLYEAELNLGILKLRDGQPAASIVLMRQAAEAKPNEARPRRYLGDGLLASGDFPAAQKSYEDALKLDPKLAPAELGLGQSLSRQGKLDEALPHYQNAVELNPELKSYLMELGTGFEKANRSNDAIALFNQFPQDPAACEEAGRLYLETKRPPEAVKAFESAVRLSPTSANRLALATAYLQNNQPDQAAPILEDALRSNPDDYDVRMAVGKIYRDRHQYPAAAEQFTTAAKLQGNPVPALNEAVSAYVLAELYPQAIATLDKIHSLNADTAGDFYYRAIVMDKLHQIKPAIAAYQKFLEMSQGKYPDQEFIARHRSKLLEGEANR